MAKLKGYGMTVESEIEKMLIKEGKEAVKEEMKKKRIPKMICRNLKSLCRKNDPSCTLLKKLCRGK